MTSIFENHAEKDIQSICFVRNETGGYPSFLNFRNNRQQGYREVIFGAIAIVFLEDWRDICLFPGC